MVRNTSWRGFQRRPTRSGLSLIELVIVFFIVLILVGLLLPAVQAARQISYRTRCANNLRKIGAAYHLFLDDRGGKEASFRGDLEWTRKLQPYLNDDGAAFICPLATFEIRLPQVSAVFFPRSKWQWVLDTSQTPKYDIPLEVNGKYCRLRNDVFGVQESPYYLEIDPLAEGDHWEPSLVIYVEPQGDGRLVLKGSRGQGTWPGSGDFIFRDQSGKFFGAGASYTFPASFPTSKFTLGSRFNVTSYGVNSVAEYFSLANDSQKVLALEYDRVVCNVVTKLSITPQKIYSDYWPFDSAPRHNGKLNVLFVDGSVRAMEPSDVNPRPPLISKEFWLPWSLQD